MSKWDVEYLKLCRKILTEGKEVENRTGINSIKIPDYNFNFNLKEEFPFLTTKQLYYRSAIKEILWIYKGINDVRWLQERGVSIWDKWEVDEDGIYRIYYPEENVPDNVPLEQPVYYNTGITGSDGRDILERMYYDDNGVYRESLKPEGAKPLMTKSTKEGEVLRAARYFGKNYAYTIGHAYGYSINKRDIFNRTVNLINAAKIDPTISDGRRIVMDLWQEDDIKDAVLKPCVFCSIWNVLDGKLNAKIVQRSCDVPLGLPFNVTQYSFLLYLLAQITGLEPGKINYSIEDAHIYLDQIVAVEEQLRRQEEIEKGLREDYAAPELVLDENIYSINDVDDRNLSNVKVLNYKHHGPIKIKLAQ